ncbi:MAG: ribonuclease III [Termitinemataceae bacterium]|nr:MAG: ribonuclease III [Termitinemataceae bacterium]
MLAFQRVLGLKFKNILLLNMAFIHRSASNEQHAKALPDVRSNSNNERLEFLGDSILGAVTSALLYTELSGNEGDLAKIKSIVVSEETLSGIALQLQIDKMLILGRGEELSGGRGKKALLADAMEALFGAIYLDLGYKSAFKFISRCIKPEIENVRNNRGFVDYKSKLQEYCQKHFRSYPQYKLVKRDGPEHEHYFWIGVTCNDKTFGPCAGKNKKTAEQDAAKLALEFFEKKEQIT